jgi:hypothetical protein
VNNDDFESDQSEPELGANAARLLTERIEGRTKSVFVTVAPKVVARGSTKCLEWRLLPDLRSLGQKILSVSQGLATPS